LTKDGNVEPLRFVIHKHKISETRSTLLRGPPRLNLSDVQTLRYVMSLARFKFICNGFSEMFVIHKHRKSFGIAPFSTRGESGGTE
jgi:hypothetical protein